MILPPTYDEAQLSACIREACGLFQRPKDCDWDALLPTFIKRAEREAQRLQSEGILEPAAARLYLTANVLPYFWDNTRLLERLQELLDEGELPNELRDRDLVSQANHLGADRFEREYLGKRRSSYTKIPYKDLDRGVPYLRELRRLWDLGFTEEYDALLQSDAVRSAEFLSETFPVSCAQRDQILARCLSPDMREPLVTIADVASIQQMIERIDAIPLLIQFQQHFHNIFLRLSAANRLHALYSSMGAEAFLAQIPAEVRDTQAAALLRMPGLATSAQREILLCILLSHPSPSYRRDELLAPLLDQATSWQEKQEIASLFSDPPSGTIGERAPHKVMVHESIFAGLQKLDPLDKTEILFYLLGKRTFISGIDNAFRTPSQVSAVNRLRWDRLLGRGHSENAEDRAAGLKKEGRFYSMRGLTIPAVKEPDAIVLLQKCAGIPIDLLFKQHNVAVSHREQLEAMTEVLLGEKGILRTPHREDVVRQVAHLMVQQQAFSHCEAEQNAIESLMTVALLHCPEEKLPSIFLDMWHLAVEGGKKLLPDIVATMMQKAGPIFVVAAQYLAHQTNALPQEWARAFRSCVDSNKVFDTTLIDAHISASLGSNPFKEVGKKKGEGSKAIVNTVTLPDGRDCAVKIFHSFIRHELASDGRLLEKIIAHINEHPELFHTQLPQNVAAVVERKMARQIDPNSEIEGHAYLRSVLSHSPLGVRFATADLFPSYSAGSLITYGHVDGISLDRSADLQAWGISAERQSTLRHATGIEVLRQLLQTGHYQSDPNLGNFLVSRDETVHWIDYGSIETLSTSDRQALVGLLGDIFAGVENALPSRLAGFISSETRGEDTEQRITHWLTTQLHEFSVGNIDLLLKEFQDFCARERYVLQPQWVSVLGTLGLLKPMLHDCPPAAYLHAFGPILSKN